MPHLLDGLWTEVYARGLTSSQCYVNPLMDLDEVRLPNTQKTKVLSVRLNKSSATAAAPPAGNIQAG
ncbi:hypothetical protein ILYODFUR_003983 [Ilyodon furcidens]|uniref:Uncharacterized protein n=1 Tax=Ilyodon furcidens TaxID=33524 RepID=A0ABV0UQ10_9TELE